MGDWLSRIARIEALEDADFDDRLVAEMERHAARARSRRIRFATPTFKDYDTPEIKGCGRNAFPAFSVTGGAARSTATIAGPRSWSR